MTKEKKKQKHLGGASGGREEKKKQKHLGGTSDGRKVEVEAPGWPSDGREEEAGMPHPHTYSGNNRASIFLAAIEQVPNFG